MKILQSLEFKRKTVVPSKKTPFLNPIRPPTNSIPICKWDCRVLPFTFATERTTLEVYLLLVPTRQVGYHFSKNPFPSYALTDNMLGSLVPC